MTAVGAGLLPCGCRQETAQPSSVVAAVQPEPVPPAPARAGARAPTGTPAPAHAAPAQRPPPQAAQNLPASPPASPAPAQPAAVPPPAPQGNPFGRVVSAASEATAATETLAEQREKLFSQMERQLRLAPAELARVREVFQASSVLSQGNPQLSMHPIGRAECREALAKRPLEPGDAVCGAPYMAALHDRDGGAPESARVCIDQFEFPDIPCEYPVVHVSAREAAQLCQAIGKRLCDAHEWEGACAGSVAPPEQEYAFGKDRQSMRRAHNAGRTKVWAYGSTKSHATCATSSFKTPGCPGGGFNSCGSNTFPAGAFPDCVSPYGVYDLHGNAAEHMNLPLTPAQLTSAGGSGATEMKGSWFIFSHYEAHEDDCRWRAPDWHPSSVMSTHSHGNYHLGFRCCKTIGGAPAAGQTSTGTSPASSNPTHQIGTGADR